MFKRFLSFLTGLSIIFCLENAQQGLYVLAAIAVSLILILLFRFHSIYLRFKSKFSSFYYFIFGLFWGSIHVLLWLQTTPMLISEPKTVQLSGYICSLPISQPDNGFFSKKNLSAEPTNQFFKVSFKFCVTQFEQQTLAFYQKNKIRLSIYHLKPIELQQVTAGSHWSFNTKLKPIHGRLNPGGFDYEKWLMSEGFIATGYVKKRNSEIFEFSLGAKYHQLRQRLYNKLSLVIADAPTNGMLFALAMGERGEISAEQWQVVKNSGTSHLLAISGLHIGIAALWSYLLFLLIFSRLNFMIQKIPAQTLAQVASLIAAAAVSLISGFGYPAQRALIMLLVYFVSRWSGRYFSLINVLATSVFIILLLQPFAILTVSFWLSVVAVAIIVLLSSYRQKLTSQKA